MSMAPKKSTYSDHTAPVIHRVSPALANFRKRASKRVWPVYDPTTRRFQPPAFKAIQNEAPATTLPSAITLLTIRSASLNSDIHPNLPLHSAAAHSQSKLNGKDDFISPSLLSRAAPLPLPDLTREKRVTTKPTTASGAALLRNRLIATKNNGEAASLKGSSIEGTLLALPPPALKVIQEEATKSRPSQSNTTLLDTNYDVRAIILEFLLTNPTRIRPDGTKWSSNSTYTDLVNISLVCHQLHEEARPIFFNVNTFYVFFQGRVSEGNAYKSIRKCQLPKQISHRTNVST